MNAEMRQSLFKMQMITEELLFKKCGENKLIGKVNQPKYYDPCCNIPVWKIVGLKIGTIKQSIIFIKQK